MTATEWLRVFAPASVANIGPGFDILGVAVTGLGDFVEARKQPSGVTISSIRGDESLPKDAEHNTAGLAAHEVLKQLGSDAGVELKLQKGVPGGSGMGSSATSAAAAAFATNAVYGSKLETRALLTAATKAEAATSGDFFADNTAPSLLGGATLIRSYDPFEVIELGVIPEARLVLVTPALRILTREARSILPKKVPLKDLIRNAGNACGLTAALVTKDYELFARSIHDCIVEPVRQKLIKRFDSVRASALEAGADAFTISGSGPTVLAVTNDQGKAKTIEATMLEAFRHFGIEASSVVAEMEPAGARVIDG